MGFELQQCLASYHHRSSQRGHNCLSHTMKGIVLWKTFLRWVVWRVKLREHHTMLGKECPAVLPHFERLFCFSDSFLQCIHSIGIIWKDNSSTSRCVCHATWSAKMLSCHPRSPYVNSPALPQFLRVGLQQNPRKRDSPGKWRPQMSTAPSLLR